MKSEKPATRRFEDEEEDPDLEIFSMLPKPKNEVRESREVVKESKGADG